MLLPNSKQPDNIPIPWSDGLPSNTDGLGQSNSTIPSSSHPLFRPIDNAKTGDITESGKGSRYSGRKRPRDPFMNSLPSSSLSDPFLCPISSNVPVVTTLDNVRRFFHFKRPELDRAATHTDNTNTRKPMDFDKHLLQEYRLHRVVKLKEIPEDLASVAQAALDGYSGDLPGDSDEFPSPDRLTDWIKPFKKKKLERESDIEMLYGMTVARGCLSVAGTLAYGHKSWSAGCLQWTFRASDKKSEASAPKNQGVADGFLSIFEEDGSSLTPDQQLVFNCFPVIAVWEFKNLNFCIKKAGLSTMEGAVNGFLEGTFPWATCEFDPWQCLGEHPHDVNSWSPMGWDAKNPPCVSYWQARDSPERRILLKERILEANRAKREAKKAARKAKLREAKEESRTQICIDDGEGSDTVTEGQEEDTVTDESDDQTDAKLDSPFTPSVPQPPGQTHGPLKQVSKFKKASRDLLQQAWTEAVRHDATFIVIHSGNTEIICIRDRLTQTLYVSDILKIKECKNYMQIHTGLMIAAIRDAEDRARLLQVRPTPKTWNPTADKDKVLDLKQKSIEEVNKILLEQVQRRPWLKIQPAERLRHFPFTKDLYHRQINEATASRESSLVPSIMSESQVSSTVSWEGSASPSQDSESSSSQVSIWTFLENQDLRPHHHSLVDHDLQKTPPDLGTIFQLCVNREPFYGRRICRGTLKIYGTLFPANFKGIHHPVFVIKNASETRDIEMLKDEHDVLCKLNEDGKLKGIPQVYGLFCHQNELEEGMSFAALVIEDMGSTLGKFLEEVEIREGQRRQMGKKRKRNVAGCVISDDQKAELRKVLGRVHDAGYAHGNLTVKNLAFKKKAVSIIGYERAVLLPSELSARVEVISNEHRKLDELLKTLVPSQYL